MVISQMSTTDVSVLVAISIAAFIVAGLIVLINHLCVMRQMKQEHLYAIKESCISNANEVGLIDYRVTQERKKEMAVNNHLMQKAEGMYGRIMKDLPKQMMKAVQEMTDEL